MFSDIIFGLTGTAEFAYILRILAAAICGILIGYERKNQAKAAGVRTHCVVACASALMMILSKYAYTDVLLSNADLAKLDPSRVAAGVVSGIGFLGAGMIFVHHKTVTGLTTAAGIWATSGVGMAIGAGLYLTGLAAAFIIVVFQIILHISPMWRHNAAEAEKDIEPGPLRDALKKVEAEILKSERQNSADGVKTIYTITITAEQKAALQEQDSEEEALTAAK